MKKLTKKEVQERFSQNEKKWSPTLMKAGWTVIPSVILERQQALGLDALDINILLHLAKYWWYSDNPPRPSKQAIAECIGVDKSTIRRRIASMEKGGLISRQPRFDKKYGQQPNSYLFDGLIKSAQPFAEESIEARGQQKVEAAKRRTRKRPLTAQKKKED
jgi:hypothetical protein